MLYGMYLQRGVYYVGYRVFVVRCMLYGFGDDEQPYAETVDLLEDLVIEYISETVSKTYLHYSL